MQGSDTQCLFWSQRSNSKEQRTKVADVSDASQEWV